MPMTGWTFGRAGVGLGAALLLSGCIAAVIGTAPNDGNVNDSRYGYVASPDGGLARAVRERLAADPELRALAIRVDVQRGTVTLRGTVTDAARAVRATRVARAVAGVVAVNNQLEVN